MGCMGSQGRGCKQILPQFFHFLAETFRAKLNSMFSLSLGIAPVYIVGGRGLYRNVGSALPSPAAAPTNLKTLKLSAKLNLNILLHSQILMMSNSGTS